MENKPKISIITVTYNAEKYLEKTINSIRNQTFTSYEYLVIDGNSNDSTLDIIKENTDIISYWISEPDNGLYDAMNKGLKIAKGEYVWFMNAGDEVAHPTTLGDVFGISINADVYYGQTLIIDEQGNEIGLRRLKPYKPLSWKSFRWGQLVSHQAFIAKTKLSPQYNTNYKYSADTDWQIRILKKAINIMDTDLILCRFLEGGRSRKTILPSLKERFIIMIENYGLLRTMVTHIIMIPRFIIFYLIHRRF